LQQVCARQACARIRLRPIRDENEAREAGATACASRIVAGFDHSLAPPREGEPVHAKSHVSRRIRRRGLMRQVLLGKFWLVDKFCWAWHPGAADIKMGRGGLLCRGRRPAAETSDNARRGGLPVRPRGRQAVPARQQASARRGSPRVCRPDAARVKPAMPSSRLFDRPRRAGRHQRAAIGADGVKIDWSCRAIDRRYHRMLAVIADDGARVRRDSVVNPTTGFPAASAMPRGRGRPPRSTVKLPGPFSSRRRCGRAAAKRQSESFIQRASAGK